MYGKFFASTFTGSMFGAGPDVFSVWGYVIANAVQSQVELNPALLAAIIGTSPERVQIAIDFLCAPDPKSRTKTDEGRRLIREGEFAYRVPNLLAYRSIKNEEERREYNRVKKAEQRERDKVKDRVNDKSAPSAQAEADLKTEAKAIKGRDLSKGGISASTSDATKKRTWLTPIEEVWTRRFGPGTFPFKQHAKALSHLYNRGEPMTEVARRLENYLAITEAQFVSVPKFVQTYGDWATAHTKSNGNGRAIGKISAGRAALAAGLEKYGGDNGNA